MIRVLADPEAVAHAAAETVIARATAAVDASGGFTVALSGGHTPRRLFELLGTEYRGRVPWGLTRVLWVDERCVPPTDRRSNYAMARSLLLDHLPERPEAVHRIRGELAPEQAAEEYDRLLATMDGLDLALLGAGGDGHTASLFPGQVDPDEVRWARAVRAPQGIEPQDRVTLTLRALNSFAHAVFLVTGGEKHPVVAAARAAATPDVGPDALPAVQVRPATEPLWLVDAAASGE
jgi:6-phosphogluconolactonase